MESGLKYSVLKCYLYVNTSFAILSREITASLNFIDLLGSYLHHNLFITLWLESKAETVLNKQPCYIQRKMYRLHVHVYRKMTRNGHFSI